MLEKITHTVFGVDGQMLIRDYLKRRLHFSTALIAKVKYGGVKLSGAVVTMRAVVKDQDVIEITLPEEDSENISPISLPLTVLYEDDWLLAVSKPKNMPVHPSRGNHLPTLANAVRAYFGRPFVFRAVNRLDRDTSGIVLIAKNQLSGGILAEDMKAGLFEKTYTALVLGVPKNSESEIIAPIRRESEGSIKRIVAEDGKYAKTHYRVLKTDGDRAFCEITPQTGRTHQIRVHMAHIGHPLYADFLYGEKIEGMTYSLRCSRLSFPHPITRVKIIIEDKNECQG